MSRRRVTTNNNSLLSIVAGDDFSADEFQASEDDVHTVRPAAPQTRRPGARTKTTAVRSGAAAPALIGAVSTKAGRAGGGPGRRTASKAGNEPATAATAAKTATKPTTAPAPRQPRRGAAARTPSYNDDLSDDPLNEDEEDGRAEIVEDTLDHDDPDVDIEGASKMPARPGGNSGRTSKKRAAPASISTGTGRQPRGRVAKNQKRGVAAADVFVDAVDALDPVDAAVDDTQALAAAGIDELVVHPSILSAATVAPPSAVPSHRSGRPTGRTAEADSNTEKRLKATAEALARLEDKYDQLVTITTAEAKLNFDSLKRATDRQAKAQADLIQSLQIEVETARREADGAADSADRTAKLEAQISQISKAKSAAEAAAEKAKGEIVRLGENVKTAEMELEKARAEGVKLADQVYSLQTSYKMVEQTNKSLTAKLAGIKTSTDGPNGLSTSASAALSRTLGSSGVGPGLRTGSGLAKNAAAIADEAATAARLASLKEDLYSDLSGLLIHSVKRDVNDDGDDINTFDCSQTGKNGTLRFHLNVPVSAKSGDVEVHYIPRIDARNDGHLVELLPEYLQDEITFPRDVAAKFYQRVIATLEADLADSADDG